MIRSRLFRAIVAFGASLGGSTALLAACGTGAEPLVVRSQVSPEEAGLKSGGDATVAAASALGVPGADAGGDATLDSYDAAMDADTGWNPTK